MSDAVDEKNNKGTGAVGVVAGTVAGVATAGIVSSAMAKAPASELETEKELLGRIIQRTSEKTQAIMKPKVEEYVRSNPPPSGKKALMEWEKRLRKELYDSPEYKALLDTEQKAVMYEHAEKIQDMLKKQGKPSSIDDVFRVMDETKNAPAVKRGPWSAFKSLSAGKKIGVGVIAAASGFGVGYLINRMQGSGTHVEQLEEQRTQSQFRSLSDTGWMP